MWLLFAAAGVFTTAFCNLVYGLPETHTQRRKLLPYLMSRPYDPSVPTAGRSYAVPSKEGRFLPSAADAIDALNAGIEEEQRAIGASEETIMRLKISKGNSGRIDVSLMHLLSWLYSC